MSGAPESWQEMTVQEIKEALAAARRRYDAALKALAPKHQGGEWAEYRTASALVLKLERAFARAKGQQYADVSDFPVRWDAGAPLPHVFGNGHRTFLVFYVRGDDPSWDGTYVTVKDPGDGQVELLALVEFNRCVSCRMGAPNDEVFSGHPLWGKGLEGYTAQVVRNSRWIRELEDINKVHERYQADRWTNLTHHILWFHDSTFECVAESYTVETMKKTFPEVLADVCTRLVR